MSEDFKIQNVFPVFATAAGLARAAGIRTTIVPIPKNNDYDSGKLSAGFQPPDPKLYDSPIGTPVYSDLELIGGTYTDQITGRSVNFPTIKFNAVIMTVQFVSRIIKTEIQGRNGTVKEYIGEDDAQITIQGVITGFNGHYPATEVNALALTKLDGTAKGGVVIGISDQFKVPVKYIGVGEGVDDIQLFNKQQFVDSLFGN
jgi:hypothetical protein